MLEVLLGFLGLLLTSSTIIISSLYSTINLYISTDEAFSKKEGTLLETYDGYKENK